VLNQGIKNGMRRAKDRENIVQSIGFVVVLVVFSMLSIYACLYDHETVSEQENRTLAERPKVHSWKKDLPNFPSAFEPFFKDHIAFRLPLISFRNMLIFEIFNASGNPSVAVGKQNWLFYKSYGITPAQLNIDPFTQDELREWAGNITERNLFLNEHHIKYLLVLAPEKGSIYSELLPTGWRRGTETSRLEQLQDYLKANTNVDFVDARKLLCDEKGAGQKTYHSNDTHWNQRSAFLICQDILRHLHIDFRSVEPVPLPLLLQGHDKFIGDLTKMLGLQSILPDYSPSIVVNKAPQAVPADAQTKLASMKSQEKAFASSVADTSLPRALILRDSFFTYITAPLSEHFRFCEFQWTNQFYPQEILKEKPNVVVNEIAERHLYEELHEHVPEITPDGAATEVVCSYGNKLALVGLSAKQTYKGVVLKLRWQSKEPIKLDYAVGLHCFTSEKKVVGAADYQPDIIQRELGKGSLWTDTVLIPNRELKGATQFGISVYHPGKETLTCDAQGSAWGTALVKPFSEYIVDYNRNQN
jgi:alginate O-acetyltransferase complex protein AlgJ